MNPTDLRAELLKKATHYYMINYNKADINNLLTDFAMPYAQQVAELQGKLDEAKAEFELCRNAYKTKNAQYHELQRQLTQLQAERDALAEKVKELEGKLLPVKEGDILIATDQCIMNYGKAALSQVKCDPDSDCPCTILQQHPSQPAGDVWSVWDGVKSWKVSKRPHELIFEFDSYIMGKSLADTLNHLENRVKELEGEKQESGLTIDEIPYFILKYFGRKVMPQKVPRLIRQFRESPKGTHIKEKRVVKLAYLQQQLRDKIKAIQSFEERRLNPPTKVFSEKVDTWIEKLTIEVDELRERIKQQTT
jgi:hypothetical protein